MATRLVQHWECRVTVIGAAGITAVLRDLTNNSPDEELATIFHEGIPELERARMHVGTLFDWKVYEADDGGYVESIAVRDPDDLLARINTRITGQA